MSWYTKKLGDICEYITRGISPRYINKGGVIVLNQKCIRNHKISYQEARKHDDLSKRFDRKKLIQVGDVLVNSTGTGTLGRVAQVKFINEPTLVDSHITIVRPIKGLFDLNFFGWAMIYVEDLIKDLGAGASGQTELSRETLRQIDLTYPESISEQRRIVKILDEIFEKTAKAKENAEKSLQNAKELFESYLQSVFVNQGEDWEVRKLNEISENLDSKRIPVTKKVRNSGKYPYYGASGIVDYVSEYIFDDDLMLVSEDGANLLARTYPIAFSISGKTWVNNHAHVLKFEKKESQNFVVYYLNSINLSPYVSGMAQPKLNQKMLNSIPIPYPTFFKQKTIVAKLDSLSAETKKLEGIYKQKQADLEELKKSVLKKAFNGEL